MTKIQNGARIVLGLIYLVFGAMGLVIAFKIFPLPFPVLPEAAQSFIKGIMGSGYFYPMLKIIETTCGVLLLTGIATPLVLVIIAPVTFNIMMFHACLSPEINYLLLPIAMVLAQIIAMSAYWKLYQPLFDKK